LGKLDLAKNTDADNSLLFDKIEEATPPSLAAPTTQSCEGSIEALNGTPPRMASPTVGNALSIRGWLAVSGEDGIVPDSVFVTLTDETGKLVYIKARSTPRNDIRSHFNQPSMPDPGFATIIDVSSLSGPYTLGLARIYKGNLEVCQQFKLPIQFAR